VCCDGVDGLHNIFQRPQNTPLQQNPTNDEHILTPSLNHTITATVLRNGYLNNTIPTTPNIFAMNISSSQIQITLQFIKEIRNDQSLNTLLNYQFEHQLHNHHEETEMDALLYEMHHAFPLASKKLTKSTSTEAKKAPIEQMEARNVYDNILLLEHIRTSAIKNYP